MKQLTDKHDWRKDDYISRINRVMDYIESHLDSDLSLETIASVAGFSRFHFHRIFKAFAGETLYQFIQRLRLEKAASQLSGYPEKSITEIALDSGFSSSATFARAFKDAFGVSASQWRNSDTTIHSNNCKADSTTGKSNGNNRKASIRFSGYNSTNINPLWRITMNNSTQGTIEIREMPEMHVAYIRHIGPYKGDSNLFETLISRLMTWAGPRGLIRFPETTLLSVYHDNPDITDEEKLRLSVCLTVPEETSVDGDIGKMIIPGGTFAVGRFELTETQFEAAWDSMVTDWLPVSGYQPDDRLCYEICLNNPGEHPENKHIVDICFPVKPA